MDEELGSSVEWHFSSAIERERLSQTFGTMERAWADIEGLGLQRACIGKVASFEIGARGISSDDIDVKIIGQKRRDLFNLDN